jgi:hypothetical protein
VVSLALGMGIDYAWWVSLDVGLSRFLVREAYCLREIWCVILGRSGASEFVFIYVCGRFSYMITD